LTIGRAEYIIGVKLKESSGHYDLTEEIPDTIFWRRGVFFRPVCHSLLSDYSAESYLHIEQVITSKEDKKWITKPS
jgi:hypothetical protein